MVFVVVVVCTSNPEEAMSGGAVGVMVGKWQPHAVKFGVSGFHMFAQNEVLLTAWYDTMPHSMSLEGSIDLRPAAYCVAVLL